MAFFFKEVELPIAVFLEKHMILRLKIGDTFGDFQINRERSLISVEVENVPRVVLYLQEVWDQDGTLTENMKQHWHEIENSSDAEDFEKHPELPAPRTKKAKRKTVARKKKPSDPQPQPTE